MTTATEATERYSIHRTKSGAEFITLSADGVTGFFDKVLLAFTGPDCDDARRKAEVFISDNTLPARWKAAPLCCCILRDWKNELRPGQESLVAVNLDLDMIASQRASETPVHLAAMPVTKLFDEGCRLAAGSGAHWGIKHAYCVRRPPACDCQVDHSSTVEA